MVQKNKNHHTNISEYLGFGRVMQAIGTTAMLAATICAVGERIHSEGTHLSVLVQPASSTAHASAEVSANDHELRRAGKEEIHHASATYGAMRRSMPVSGTL